MISYNSARATLNIEHSVTLYNFGEKFVHWISTTMRPRWCNFRFYSFRLLTMTTFNSFRNRQISIDSQIGATVGHQRIDKKKIWSRLDIFFFFLSLIQVRSRVLRIILHMYLSDIKTFLQKYMWAVNFNPFLLFSFFLFLLSNVFLLRENSFDPAESNRSPCYS